MKKSNLALNELGLQGDNGVTIGTFLSMDLALFLECILSYCDM